MHRALSVAISLVLLSAAPACGFYFGDDDDPCEDVDFGGGGFAEEPVADVGLINPETGQCEFFGGGSVPLPPCDSECGPCTGTEGDRAPPAVPQPSWGYCESFCTGLDEATCLETPGCRGGYVDGGDNPDVFDQCWMTDQSGPIQGDCTGLDAYTCSMHDDCIAVHTNACAGDSDADPLPPDGLVETCLGVFSHCADETGGGDPGNCYDEVLCDTIPPECPPDTLPGVKDGCYTGFCIPVAQCESAPACAQITEEMACIGRSDCTALYEGVDCSCDANGCTCTDWLFDTCQDAAP